MSKSLTYDALGSSSSKAGLHRILKQSGLESSSQTVDTFCHLVSDWSGDESYFGFLHADGAGTKCIVHYLYYRETGEISHFKGLAQDALAMNLDDVFATGPAESLALSNAIARNALLLGDDILEQILLGYKEIVEALSKGGIKIQLAGGETADCGDSVRTVIVDATLAGRIPKIGVVHTNRIAVGDVIIGLSSTGQASYESQANSGISSNGLTLARHSLLNKEYCKIYPEIVNDQLSVANSYLGPFKVTDNVPGSNQTVGDLLMSPTRTYAPLLQQIHKQLGSEIHAIIHLTGGGQTKALRFGQGKHYVKEEFFAVPPIFELVQKHGQVSWEEMYRVFNMGHRIEIFVTKEIVGDVISLARDFQIEAKEVGLVRESIDFKGGSNLMELRTPHGTFHYRTS